MFTDLDVTIHCSGDARIVETDADTLSVLRGALYRLSMERPDWAGPVEALAEAFREPKPEPCPYGPEDGHPGDCAVHDQGGPR